MRSIEDRAQVFRYLFIDVLAPGEEMGHYIDTLSHGSIDGSYLRTDVRFVGLGTYVLPMLSLCERVRSLAGNPQAKRDATVRITRDQYWDIYLSRENHLVEEALTGVKRVFDHYRRVGLADLRLLAAIGIEEHTRNDEQFFLSPEEERHLYEIGSPIDLRIADDFHSISAGEYTMSPPEFGLWIMEITAGGMTYWGSGKLPTFGRLTRASMNASDNQFFQKINKYQIY
ncbi:hypothetical protein HY772_01555 [Candidatus Woesearchaeota archaeon]|nr:hypothetical protein [Candidatus Woesearchaeota archaeon]